MKDPNLVVIFRPILESLERAKKAGDWALVTDKIKELKEYIKSN